jgi:ABC-2 type transport system permease protein
MPAMNAAFFAAWCVGLALLFVLALRLPLRIRGPRWRAAVANALLTLVALGVTGFANVAVFRHDIHLDLSREGANTPPPQLESLVDGLKTDVTLTYFYNSADENALKARDLLSVAARQNEHFRFRDFDLDKEPAAARRLGVRAYNSVVAEADERRVLLENTVDLGQIAFAALRVLKERADVVCLVNGHGEDASATPGHVHFSHVETLRGHDSPGSGDVLVGDPDGLDRFELAMTTLGYTVRPVVLATVSAIPADCSAVADIGPRLPYAPGEADLLSRYAANGGHILLMLDPISAMGPELTQLLGKLGVASDEAVVIDPLNHYGSDPDKVAVPYYPPHPITEHVAMTIFPDARPLRIARPPEGVATTVLVTSSADSYLRPATQPSQSEGQSAGTSAAPGGERRSPAVLAVALEGRWPQAPAPDKSFRLVVIGNSNFARNSYFPYVSNGDLAVARVRWVAGDQGISAKPQTFALERIDLTRRQMRDIFIVVELLLPLSVVALGGIVWWRRR